MPALPPAGTGPAAAFGVTGVLTQVEPPVILADAIDPLTGEYLSLTRGVSIADGMAVEALRVQRRTGGAARDLGNRFRELTHVDDESATRLEPHSFMKQDRSNRCATCGLDESNVLHHQADPGPETSQEPAADDAENTPLVSSLLEGAQEPVEA